MSIKLTINFVVLIKLMGRGEGQKKNVELWQKMKPLFVKKN